MLSRQSFMHRDACQPGGKLGPPGKLVQMFVRAHVGVLHYVLSFAIISQNSPSHPVEALVVTAHDDFKHPRLARQHTGHNLFVTQGLSRSSHFHWADHTDPPYGWSHDSKNGYRSNRTSQAENRNVSVCNRFAPANSILLEAAHMNKGFDSRLDQGWWVLRIGLGVGPFLAGLDKYFNLLTNWPGYISPLALKILPFSGQTFMHIVGVVEMIVGLAILTKWTRLGAYVASAWLVLIAINLVWSGMFFDIAVRDVEMALAAFVLARMTEVRRDALRSEAPNELPARAIAA